MPLNANSISTATAALVLVLGLVVLAARALRATGLNRGRFGTSTGQRLSIQESLAVDQGRRLYLVRCDGQDVILLAGGNADVVVGWLPQQNVAGRVQA